MLETEGAAAIEARHQGMAWPNSVVEIVCCGYSKGHTGKWEQVGGEEGTAPWGLTGMSRTEFIKLKPIFLHI